MKRAMTTTAVAAALALGATALAQGQEYQSQPEGNRLFTNQPQTSRGADTGQNALFAAMDADGSGWISREEYVSFISAAANVSRSDANRQFDEIAGPQGRLTLPQLASAELPSAASAGDIVSRRALFSAMDRNADGYVSSSEYASFMNRNLDVGRAQARARFREIVGQDDRASVEELIALDESTRLVTAGGDESESRRIFAVMDADGDGYVAESEYVSFLSNAANVSQSQARQRFRQIAGTGDRIAFQQFARARSAQAQQDAGATMPMDRQQGAMMMDRQDRRGMMMDRQDRQGMMDGQARQGMTQMFREMDRNSDNTITRDEYLAWRQQQAAEVFDRIAGPSGSLTLNDMAALRQEWMRSAELRQQ